MGLRSCKEVQTLRFYQRFTIFSIRLTSPKIGQYTQLMEKFLIPIRQFLDHLAQCETNLVCTELHKSNQTLN